MTELEAQLARGPDVVEAIFSAAARPLSLHDPTYSWHGVAEGAAQNAAGAFEAGDASLGLAWSQCAVTIYDALASDVAEPNAYDLSSMYVRVRAIRATRRSPGDPIRDPEIVIRWVRSALLPSIGETLRLSAAFLTAVANGAEPSLGDGRKLRVIKNRLGVLQQLDGVSPVPADLRRWLDARARFV